MRATVLAVLAAAIVAGLAASASAGEWKAGDLTLSDPWIRGTLPKAAVAAGFVTIGNGDAAEDRLLSAAAGFAERVELHEMRMRDGVMKMRPLADGLAIPAGGSVEIRPGGHHLMFMGLKEPLRQGETRKVTLVFERAGSHTVPFAVAAPGASAPPAGGTNAQHAH